MIARQCRRRCHRQDPTARPCRRFRCASHPASAPMARPHDESIGRHFTLLEWGIMLGCPWRMRSTAAIIERTVLLVKRIARRAAPGDARLQAARIGLPAPAPPTRGARASISSCRRRRYDDQRVAQDQLLADAQIAPLGLLRHHPAQRSWRDDRVEDHGRAVDELAHARRAHGLVEAQVQHRVLVIHQRERSHHPHLVADPVLPQVGKRNSRWNGLSGGSILVRAARACRHPRIDVRTKKRSGSATRPTGRPSRCGRPGRWCCDG